MPYPIIIGIKFYCENIRFLPFHQFTIKMAKNKLPFLLYTQARPGFVNIAHRGFKALYPENTMVAFRAAQKSGADMLEVDITLSQDGIPVVIHDTRLNRTTNGKGRVSAFTLSELKKLDAGSWFSEKFKGEHIPTLEEVLAFAKDTIALNIEIKPEAVGDTCKGGIEEKTLNMVKAFGMENYVLLSSFNYSAIRHIKQLDGNIATALLYEKAYAEGKPPSEQVRAYKANAFNCDYRELTKKWMSDLKSNQIPVFIYTVNDEVKLKKYVEWGVDGVFTDNPALVLDYIRR